MECFSLPQQRVLVVVEGDITRLKADAIVNPANSLMIMGGGVAGALKRVGGDEIEKEALRYAPVPVGEAIATTAGRLGAKFVIHAPTMEKPAMRIPLENAIKATRAALKLASRLGVKSIAFPAMGAGVGGLSVREVSRAMAEIAREWSEAKPDLIIFVAYGSEAYKDMLSGVREALGGSIECPAGLDLFR